MYRNVFVPRVNLIIEKSPFFVQLCRLQGSLVNNVNMVLMNVNQIHVQLRVNVLIYQIVIHVFVVRRKNNS